MDKETMKMDLENTRKELEAYTKILDGFRMLQALPENPPHRYSIEIHVYENLVGQCAEFYLKLKDLYEADYGKEGE